MAVNKYICVNGDFLKNTEPVIFINNRAFRYGDSLVENIHAYSTEPQFLDLHLNRLIVQMQFLSMDVPAFLNEANLKALVIALLNKNRIFGSAGIRLTVYRNNGEHYITDDQSVSFVMESYALQGNKYELNDKGLTLGISGYIKTAGEFAPVKKANAILYQMAANEGRKNKLDAVILLNQWGRIVETPDSNVFLVSGKSIFTPALEQGCIHGIMRSVLLKLAAENGFSVNEQSILTPAALPDAEEIFLTSALQGLRWVGAFGQTRYFNRVAKFLTLKLNEYAFR